MAHLLKANPSQIGEDPERNFANGNNTSGSSVQLTEELCKPAANSSQNGEDPKRNHANGNNNSGSSIQMTGELCKQAVANSSQNGEYPEGMLANGNNTSGSSVQLTGELCKQSANSSQNGEDPEENLTNGNNTSGSSIQNTGELYKQAVCGYSLMAFRKQRFYLLGGSALERQLSFSLQYIEGQCTAKYGFLTRVSSEPTMQHSELGIYNIFDSAFITGTLCDAGFSLSSVVVDSIKRLLLECRNQRSGVWNYFYPEYHLIPTDPDTSSVTVATLINLGIPSDITEEMGKNIIRKGVFHSDGLIDVYFAKRDSETENGFSSPVFQNWPVIKRVCVAVTANFLYLQEKVGNRSDILLPSYDLINRFLQAVLVNDLSNPVVTQYAKCYKNIDFILYLISKLSDSELVSKEKLKKIVQKRLLLDQTNPISIACRILIGIKCGLQDYEYGRKQLTLELQNLINFQRSDFSFPEHGLYNAHNRYHFGSCALTTSLAVSSIFEAMKAIPDIERDLHFALLSED